MNIFGQVFLYLGCALTIGFGTTALVLKLKKKGNIFPWLIVAMSGILITIIGGVSWGSYTVGYNSGIKEARRPLNDSEMKAIANLYDEEDTDAGESKEDADNKIKFGDSVEYGDNGVKISVISAKKTDEKKLDNKSVVPVEVIVSLSNKSGKSIELNQHDFDLYDGKNEQGVIDNSSFGNQNADSIAAGKKAVWKLYYSAKHDGPFSVSYNSEYQTDIWQ